MGVRLDAMTLAQERAFVQCTTARADLWAARWGNHPRASVWSVLAHISRISVIGLRDMSFHYLRQAGLRIGPDPRPSVRQAAK